MDHIDHVMCHKWDPRFEVLQSSMGISLKIDTHNIFMMVINLQDSTKTSNLLHTIAIQS